MTDIVMMRFLFLAGLLALVAAAVLVSYAIVAVQRWFGSRREIERMPRVRATRWRTP